MPIIHISLRTGKPEAYRQAIFDGLYPAMRETLHVPEDDQFMTMSEHGAANFRTGTAYGVARSDDVVYIQFTVFRLKAAATSAARSTRARRSRRRRCSSERQNCSARAPASGRRTYSSPCSMRRKRTGQSVTALRNSLEVTGCNERLALRQPCCKNLSPCQT